MGLTRARVTWCPAVGQLSLGVGEPVLGCIGSALPRTGLPNRRRDRPAVRNPASGPVDEGSAQIAQQRTGEAAAIAGNLGVGISCYELLWVLTKGDPLKGGWLLSHLGVHLPPSDWIGGRTGRPSDRACCASVVVLRSDAGVCVVRGWRRE